MQNLLSSLKPRGAKRALQRKLRDAISELEGKAPLRDASVHEARKDLKRARATLRLLRDAIGETAYRRANRRIRDAARPLSRVRDAKALIDAVEKLRASTNEARPRTELDMLEQELQRTRKRARSEVLKPARVARVRRSVESVLTDSRRWPAPTDDALRRGVERLYRKGRKAFARAEADTRDLTLHESRKETKHLGKALKVLGPRGRGIEKRVKRAESIADALGDDHDLALLRTKVAERRRSASARQALLEEIERRREKLQRKAEKQSRRLYRRKPKAFVDALDLHGQAR